ncbi:hypothetical protein [Pseudarthrobacter sp. NS4]|uniref:hypothetical protein n=1 Tax=Pseudarthrobacter sp. NS4 TaxID=2973976 RepID=UPI002162F246|nr:hypothetical protein [Pseudarthrobacter sp. NS4]
MPPIPDAHHAAFDSLVTRARQLFGNAVEEKLIAPYSHRLPTFRVGQLSVVGEQWLVVDVEPGPYSRHPHQRWELDWNSDLEKAKALLEKYHVRQLLAPSSGDVLVARLIALVGEDGEATVSTEQAEFDRTVTVTPHRRGAIPFEVLITSGFVVVINGPDLGWWTFGGDYEDDGVEEAQRVLEHLLIRGGTIRITRRASELLDTDGSIVSGPHRDAVRTRHTKNLHFTPYRQ